MTEERVAQSITGIVVVDADPVDYVDLLRLRSSPESELSFHLFLSGRSVLRVLPTLTTNTLPISLCLINTRLPDMSGFDLLQMLQSSLNNSRGVLIGSDYRLEDERAARHCGAAFYLCKPLQKSWFERIKPAQLQEGGTPKPLQISTRSVAALKSQGATS